MTDALPPFHLALRLAGERCLVVGAGPVAARKAGALLECGGLVTVVAPEISPAMEVLAADHLPPALVLERRPYRSGEVDGYRLAVTATGVAAVDRSVYLDAEAARVLVNSADDPDSCSFLVPAVLRTGDVSIAVSTGGVSPFLAGWVRRRVGTVVGPEVAVLARLVGEARVAVRAAGAPTEGLDWDGLVDDGLWPLLCAGDESGARSASEKWVAAVLAERAGEHFDDGGGGRRGGRCPAGLFPATADSPSS